MTGSDIRYAVRSLMRQRLATLLVLGMLTLGIAASVTVFGLINGLFLRPFPFPEPERLVYVNEKAPRWTSSTSGSTSRTSTTGGRSSGSSRALPATTARASTPPTGRMPTASRARR